MRNGVAALPAPPRSRNCGDARGYVLLVFTLFAALLVVGLYRILPKYVFEGQRIKEEELIFRGQQYRRGIQLYVRKFGRYPNSLDELENTNEIRFIRKLYPDPMTEDGEWRLVHIGPDGTFYDSVNLTGAGTSTASSASSSTNPAGSSSQPGGANPFDLTPRDSGSGATSGDPSSLPSSNPSTTQQPRASATVTAQPGRTFGGGGIAGVGTKNEGAAIKVVNNYTHYNEWEFIYDYRTDPQGLAAVNRVSGGGQQQGQQPNQPGGQQRPPQPGQPPVGRNPLTGQPIGTTTPPGIGFGTIPFPGAPQQPGSSTPTWPGGRPPTTDPFARP
ncbi:MAG: hypothetical protein HY651_04530 [Acidobacteria bacterium]|nr:hypothetical protein [Acidobacteriota bacterium]